MTGWWYTKTWTSDDDYIVEEETANGLLVVSSTRTNGDRSVTMHPRDTRFFPVGRIAGDGTLHDVDGVVIGCAANHTAADLNAAAHILLDRHNASYH